jgi:tRNA 2-thiouridine synthesizing protein A
MIQDAQELDARGLNCPLPALIAKKSLTGMMSAQVLEVFAKQTRNELLSSVTTGNEEFIFPEAGVRHGACLMLRLSCEVPFDLQRRSPACLT